MKILHRKRFDVVGKCIHPRIGCKCRRKSHNKLGVEDSHPGHHHRIADHEFAALRYRGNDRTPAYLAAGAGCCGDGNHGRQRALNLKISPGAHIIADKGPVVSRQDPDNLGHIQWAASSETDNPVTAGCGVCHGRILYIGFTGIGLNITEHGKGHL